ncbi:hypothetical protein LSM04_001920 [Trypanosoma melophagium]|uniref:uncharacterized protein n=1 Tax=Trypanosoma melophagium TaxID=715481 RepID=UPI00351A86D4|nr:hypothetical protein LSM04_001920 [Trypanosoma melophagium]
MVRRSDRASGELVRRKSSRGAQSRLQRRRNRKGGKKSIDDDDVLEVQRPGALSLNNPLIPPDLDEDIDDDLAFNSEDEEKYGHFFNKKTKPDSTADSTGGKKKKKKGSDKKSGRQGGGDVGDSEDALVLQQLRALGEIDEDDDLDFHERDGNGDDDEYIDLADMLDAAEDGVDKKGRASSSKNKKKKRIDEDGIVKKRRRARVTEEAESIYGPAAVEGSYSSNIRQVVAATPLPSTQARVQQSLENKHNLISVDVDDTKKEALVRGEVRRVVAEDLAKYETFLREQQNSKHVQLPMPMPESNPVPSTLGAIAAAAEAQFSHQKDGNIAATLDSEKIGKNTTRASAFRLAGKMNALLSGAGLLRPQLNPANAEDDVVPLGGDDDNNNNYGIAGTSNRNDDGSVPTTSYMAKLKAMLSYENARRRRLNRIKSKTYRRILRKEKEREKERREKAFELLHPEKARARLAEKLAKARMEERVTQKHKNTSKWVRHAKRFAQFDDNTKDALNEQHMLHQKLMRKMEEDANEDEYLNADGDGRADSEAASSEEERVVDYLIAEATGKNNSQEQGTGNSKKNLTSVLWNSVDGGDKGKGRSGAGGSEMTPTEKARLELRGMKFMQQAREREEKCYAEVLEQLQEDIRRDMRGETLDSDDEVPDLDEINKKSKGKKKGKTGSYYYSSAVTASIGQTIGRKVFQQENDRNNGIKGVENIQLKKQSGIDAYAPQEEDYDDEEGEVISKSGSDEDDAKDDSYSINEDNDSEDEKEKKPEPTKMKKVKKHRDTKNEFAGARRPHTISGSLKENGVVTHSSSSSKPITSSVSTSSGEKNGSSTRITILPGGSKRPRHGDDLHTAVNASGSAKRDEEEERKEQESHVDDEMTLQQQQEYLIARAFAGDEVDADFLAEKSAQVETIMRPVDKNATLPGWGEWGGADARLNTRHQAKLQAMQMQREIERTTLLKSRADTALDHVIINHDGVELVPDRMLLHMIPRPFSNPTEFARSMRHPHGPEWNTALTFKEANQPRVEVRQGHAVLPLDLSLRTKKKKMKTKRRKTEATV